MARIRTIKPEFFTSEQIADCSPTARLLFVGCWCFCDDQGAHPLSMKRLKMEVFPGDNIRDETIQELFDELHRADLVQTYKSDGRWYFVVTGWRHQKIEKPSIKFPVPKETYKFGDHSATIRRPLDDCPPPEGKGRESKGREDKEEVAYATSFGKNCESPEEVFLLIQQSLETAKLARPRKLTAERRRKLKNRLLEDGWLDDLRLAFDRLPVPGGGWQPDLDWLIENATNVQRILEGRYDWRSETKGRRSTTKEILECFEQSSSDGSTDT